MSTQVIKAFFEQARASKQVHKIKKIAQVAPEEVYVVDQKKLDLAYQTLKNWTIYFPVDLTDYFDQLDQEEYEYVLSKKNDFPLDVQEVLWGLPVYKVGEATKLKVVDYTDAMYNRDKMKKQQEFDKKVDEELAQCDTPSRPADMFDEKLEFCRANLKKQEEELETMFKAPTKKYVAPSMRKQVMETQPEIIEKKKQIQTIKNEIQDLETYCETSNNDWKRIKRHEMREKIAEALFEVQ